MDGPVTEEINKEVTTEADETDVSLWKIIQLNRPEWNYLAFGIVGSLIMGLSTPIYSIVFGKTLGILDGLDVDVLRNQSNIYALIYVAMGIFTGFGAFLQSYMFSIAGESLTSRLRGLTLQSILSQEMAFFDLHENSVGSLCSRLSSDASNIQGATGARIGMLIQVKFY